MKIYSKIQYIAFSILYSKINGNFPKYNYKNLAKIFLHSKENDINLFEASEKEIKSFFEKFSINIFNSRQKNIVGKIKEFIDIFANNEKLLMQAEEEYILCKKNNINILTYEDDLFPKKLKILDDISQPVYTVYFKGPLLDFDKLRSLAIVGSRKAEEIGKKLAKNIAKKLDKTFIIISGLAIGIDTFAHIGALKSKIPTVAVLGQGLNKIEQNLYPKENIKLGLEILKNSGMILSEVPPSKRVNKYYLLYRNRIQAALSDYIIIIETAEKGGTIKTIFYGEKLKKKILIFNPKQEQLKIIQKNNPEVIKGNIKLLKNSKFLSFSNEDELFLLINSRTLGENTLFNEKEI
ncbi:MULTISPECIES: DNA-processing protein DprA [unclassified Thermosipho (in: thermotogales)]|uniref:DNA-processing protein DprA n=1 Tax=unclassified Thermosipho (in: thermotogales) TaxID=2676525 RepID=UPI000986A41A|nr:DNA-processing protein DprA [Thermosipho sp. 1223]MBT1248721.1 hypothetical protein [Thermosipho sp. 1244]OOC47650.1 hypothetical protein XO09_00025 [Thermosipho sp. 1223]